MEKAPRVVLVTRPTDYQLLLERHGTRGQAEFFLHTREQSIEPVEAMHLKIMEAVDEVRRTVPETWRAVSLTRGDLDRFVFEANDLIVAVGQDGLIANLARYLDSQPVIGINPDPQEFPGVLVPHASGEIAGLLSDTVHQRVTVEQRTMVEACLDDGQRIVCLNEVFIGHASHQSARYRISTDGDQERQSSSGLIVTTGTGATGWASSIHSATHSRLPLPEPVEPALAFFVREPWTSAATGSGIREGRISRAAPLTVISEMDDRGVIFGDGMESDFLPFSYGSSVHIRPAARALNLVANRAS
jgi:NAD kinase